MTKALRLVVAVVVLEGLVLFGAVVPGELEQTLAVARLFVARQALVGRVGEEIQIEAGSFGLVLANQGHTKSVLVKLERLFNVLDAKHGMVLRAEKCEVSRVCASKTLYVVLTMR